MALRGLMQLEPDPDKRLKYAGFVDIYANLSDTEREQYERDYPEETNTMRSFSMRMREEGERIGERRGIQLGEAHMLLLLLEEKFGPVSDEVRTQVQNADPDSLLRWFRQTLKADNMDEVLRQPTPPAKPPLPIPSLHIADQALGKPRQPVPLRLACLATGRTGADFRSLLAVIGRRFWMNRRR